MFKHQNLLKLITLFFFLGLSHLSMADSHGKMTAMKLDNALSSLSFVSVKKGSAGEAHHIRKLSGSISTSGELSVVLDLASVDTKVEIRDQRMKEFLFDTAKHPTATITANIGNKIPAAGVIMRSGEVTLSMHGASKSLPVNAIIVNTGDKLVMTSATPIILKAADFGMEAGVKKLQELAKLPSVATAVPVSFALTFSK